MARSRGLRVTTRVAAGTLFAGAAVTGFAGVALASPGWGSTHVAHVAGTNGHGPSKSAGHFPVTICHRTDSNTNPYVVITVDADAADGALADKGGGDHTKHTGPVWNDTLKASHMKWGDIIPAYTFTGGSYGGLNWDASGQAIWNNGCKVPTPSPTPTQSSSSPTPTESISVTPTNTVTTTVTTQPTQATQTSTGSPTTPPTSGQTTGAVTQVVPTPSSTVLGEKVVRHPTKQVHQPVASKPVVQATKQTQLPFTGSNSGLLFGTALIMLGAGSLLLIAGRRRTA